jgi:hypothetical protein
MKLDAIKKLIEDVQWEVNSGKKLSRQYVAEIVSAAADEVAAIEAARQSEQRTACPVPHPQQDFEFICDLCGEHVPAHRR